jgi:hypothetical protein
MHLYVVMSMRFTPHCLRPPRKPLSVFPCQLTGRRNIMSGTTPGSMVPAHFGQVRLSAIAVLRSRLCPPSRKRIQFRRLFDGRRVLAALADRSTGTKLERYQPAGCGGPALDGRGGPSRHADWSMVCYPARKACAGSVEWPPATAGVRRDERQARLRSS